MASAMDQRNVKKADIDENFLTCEICTEFFKRAKNLPCGHIFCQECLEKWAKKNEGKELTCPSCRKPWQIPTGGVEKLTTNYHLNSMVDYVLASQTVNINSGLKKCEFCQIHEATSACVECRQLACNTCAKGHKRTKTMASHQVISLERYRADYENQTAKLKAMECDQHPGILLEYYCQTCSIPICMKCTIIEHRVPEHTHFYLSEAARDARKSMWETLEMIKDRLKYYDEKEANIKLVRERLTDSKQRAILEVKNHTVNLVKKIQRNEQEIVKEITDAYEVKAKVLNSQIDRIELAKGQVKSSFEYSKRLLELATDEGLMSVHKRNQEMMKSLVNEKIQVNPLVNYHLQYSTDPIFSNIKQGKLVDNKAVAGQSVLKIVQPYKKVDCRLVTHDMYGNEVKEGGAELKVEVVAEGKKLASYITDNNNGTYDITFQPSKPGTHLLSLSLFGQPLRDSPIKIKSLQLPLKTHNVVGGKGNREGQLNFPSGVAVSKVGEIFVADENNRRIQVFDMSGKYKRLFTVDCSGRRVIPHGVAFTREDHLAIVDGNANQVCVCDTDGKLLRQFGQGELNDPCGLAAVQDGKIHVVENHCVKTFRMPGGELVRTIGCQGGEPGQFQNPCSVAVNSGDQIIVSDSGNHRVQVFDPSGNFLFACQGEGRLGNPSGVTVDQYDNIIVCNGQNNRSNYDYGYSYGYGYRESEDQRNKQYYKKDCIQLFSSKGEYIGRVDDSKNGVKGPVSITTVPGQSLKLIVTEAITNENHYKLRIM